MSKPKIESIKINNYDGKIEVKVRFANCQCRITRESKGFAIRSVGLTSNWYDYKYKLVKYPDHILLKSDKNDKTLTGTKKIMDNCRYPYYGVQADKVIEEYGSEYDVIPEGDNIKLFPVRIEEVKQVTEEILEAIKRYETENNLIKK